MEGIMMVGPNKKVAAFCDKNGNITTEEIVELETLLLKQIAPPFGLAALLIKQPLIFELETRRKFSIGNKNIAVIQCGENNILKKKGKMAYLVQNVHVLT